MKAGKKTVDSLVVLVRQCIKPLRVPGIEASTYYYKPGLVRGTIDSSNEVQGRLDFEEDKGNINKLEAIKWWEQLFGNEFITNVDGRTTVSGSALGIESRTVNSKEVGIW